MRAHLIENGVVVNTIEVNSLDDLPGLVEASTGGIGWTFDGTNFMPPPIVERVTKPTPTKEELLVEMQVLMAKIQALQ